MDKLKVGNCTIIKISENEVVSVDYINVILHKYTPEIGHWKHYTLPIDVTLDVEKIRKGISLIK